MSRSVFVDRVESGLAVIVSEGGDSSFELPVSFLPSGVGEGRWLKLALEPDPAKDAAMGAKARGLRAGLAKGDDGGDFSL